MKKFVVIVLIFCTTGAWAQPLSFHVLGGLSNYNGDLQQKKFLLKQAKGAISAGISYNITPKLAIRSDYTYTRLSADDKNTGNKSRLARNLNFSTVIQELSWVAEYSIFDLRERKLSPYIFAGVGVYRFNPYTTARNGAKVYLSWFSTEGQGLPEYPDRKPYKRIQYNVPLGAGIRFALTDQVNIGMEGGYRKLFTDYLDDVSSTYVDKTILQRRRGLMAVQLAFRGDEVNPTAKYPAENATRGYPSNNDLYYFLMFRLDVKLPWFGNSFNNSFKSDMKKLRCPAW